MGKIACGLLLTAILQEDAARQLLHMHPVLAGFCIVFPLPAFQQQDGVLLPHLEQLVPHGA